MLTRALLALLLLTGVAWAQTSPVTTTPYSAGQEPGTTTTDNACAGCVGEFMSVVASNSTGTATFTSATPTVVTVSSWSGGLNANAPAANCLPTTGASCIQPVCFTNSGGALPTGIVVCDSTHQYYIDPASYSGNTFKIATSIANAIAGTDVAASSTGTGTQTALSGMVIASNTATGIVALNLTPGDWDCSGELMYAPAGGTTTSQNQASINNTVSVASAQVANNAYTNSLVAVAANTANMIRVGPVRRSLSAVTSVILNTFTTFAVATNQAYGFLGCRRRR